MKSIAPALLLTTLAVAILPVTANDAPRLLPFQARFTDAAGKPIADGASVIQFQIFSEPTGGTPIWAGELHRVTVNGGLVNVVLGTKNPLPLNYPGDDSRPFFGSTLYLQATPDANGDGKINSPADEPLSPRQAIIPVLFASETSNARKLGGYGWSDLLADGATNPTTGQISGSKLKPGSVSEDKISSEVIGRIQSIEHQLPPGGVLSSLNVADSFTASVGCADLLIGHSSRRGRPGRALVDLGDRLFVNFDRDWPGGTVIAGLITTGFDLAESYPVASEESLVPGSVVVIDPDQPGRLRRSTQAYDRKVAGIVSGANGLNRAILMGEAVADSDRSAPLALSGRVYCEASAENGAISPGDLLTTSATPGHAMKVTDFARGQGAIIGKAMTELREGRGYVLVLVTLQ